MSSYSQWSNGWGYTDSADPYSSYTQFPSYSSYLADSMEAYQSQHHHLVHHHQMSRTTESKPRLSKEEVETLEAEFQKNHKPNSITKKALAESMRVDNARINNWFQNRRAREKKENNIREYEARQKMDKVKSDVESGSDSPAKRERNLVASSAPFPGAPASSASPAEDATELDQSSDASGAVLSDGRLDMASPDTTSPVDAIKASSIGPKIGYSREATSVKSRLPLSTDGTDSDDPSPLFSTDDEASDYFDRVNGSYSEYWVSDKTPGHEDGHQSYGQFAPVGYNDAGFPGTPQSPQDAGSHLKSPNDLASRRNRRAPQLAINPTRSHSSGLLRGGMDLNRRAEFGSSMRRVVSATGSGRVSKPIAAPRCQAMDRSSGEGLNRKQSPIMAVPRVKTAPPTPNTPVLPNQPGKVADSAIPAPFDVVDGLASDLAAHDPTFRTPPTTPGVMDNVFNFNVHGVPMSEVGLVNSGVTGYQNDYEVSSMSMTVPNYIANAPGCSSQPESPSFTAQMGPAYFGYSGGNTEYNWSDDSASASSLQGQNPHNVHFMNMTSTSFPVMER